MELTICATSERVMMIEAGGQEIPEDVMINAIRFGFDSCQEIIKFQEEAMAKFGKEKMVPELYKPSAELEAEIARLKALQEQLANQENKEEVKEEKVQEESNE